MDEPERNAPEAGAGQLLQGDSTALWHALVRDGEQRAGTLLDEDVESYLVFALMRHLRDAPLLQRTMALELLAAAESSGRARVDELRDVGDRCLLIAGLFPRLAERRRVDPAYFAALGRGAYGNVADAARQAYAELFARLAAAFDAMVTVLGHAAATVEFGRLPFGASRPTLLVAPAQRRIH